MSLPCWDCGETTIIIAHNRQSVDGRHPKHAVLVRYRRCENCGAKYRSEEIIVWDSKRDVKEPDYMDDAFD